MSEKEWCGKNFIRRLYTCKDLQQIEGCPQCGPDRHKNTLNLYENGNLFQVCSIVGGWLLERGIKPEDVGVIEMAHMTEALESFNGVDPALVATPGEEPIKYADSLLIAVVAELEKRVAALEVALAEKESVE